MDQALQGLYAITPDTADPHGLLTEVRAALRGGARLVQYRNKVLDPALQLHHARSLLKVCREAGVPMIVNDDIELAVRIDADGVHLGRTDGSISAARGRLGSGKLIGASCYNELALARDAERAGADYVAFGSFFPSATKPNAVTATPDLLMEAKRSLNVPLIAIGGITPLNAAPLIAAGADMLAVVTALFNTADVFMAAQQLSQLFISHHVRQKQSAV